MEKVHLWHKRQCSGDVWEVPSWPDWGRQWVVSPPQSARRLPVPKLQNMLYSHHMHANTPFQALRSAQTALTDDCSTKEVVLVPAHILFRNLGIDLFPRIKVKGHVILLAALNLRLAEWPTNLITTVRWLPIRVSVQTPSPLGVWSPSQWGHDSLRCRSSTGCSAGEEKTRPWGAAVDVLGAKVAPHCENWWSAVNGTERLSTCELRAGPEAWSVRWARLPKWTVQYASGRESWPALWHRLGFGSSPRV